MVTDAFTRRSRPPAEIACGPSTSPTPSAITTLWLAARPSHAVHPAARPPHLEQVHRLRRPQAEAGPRVVLAVEAGAGADLPNLAQTAGEDLDPGPHAVAVGAPAHGPDLEPVALVASLVSQQVGAARRMDHEDIRIPVVVIIAEGGSPADLGQGEGLPGCAGDILEAALPGVAEELVGLRVRGGGVEELHVVQRMPVGDEDVQEPVVVVVEKGGAPADIGQRRASEARPHRLPGEQAVSLVAVEAGGLAVEVGDHEVEEAVVVVVAEVGPHAGLRAAVAAVAHPRQQGHVGEGAVAVVAVEEVGGLVVGHEDVHVAVAVVVGGGEAHPLARGIEDPGRGGDVGKGAVTGIAVEDVGRPGEILRAGIGPQVRRRVLARSGEEVRRQVPAAGVEGVLHVVGHVEVEETVVVVIEEGAARAPRRVAHPGPGGEVGEGPVPPAAQEDVRSVVGDVEVGVAVVVVVRRGDADAVAPVVGAGLAADLAEGAVPQVAVELVGLRGLGAVEGVAVDGVDVEAAVAVVVEEGAARPHGLDEVLAAGAAVGVVEADAGLIGDVDEGGLAFGGGGGGGQEEGQGEAGERVMHAINPEATPAAIPARSVP